MVQKELSLPPTEILQMCYGFETPKIPPRNPPPEPPEPPLLASSSIHILRNSLSFISSTFVIIVFSCASCLLKLSSVGIELICFFSQASAHLRRSTSRSKRPKYLIPSSPISGESNCTSANPTPPCSSATPFSIASFTTGRTARYVGHQEAVQKVMRGFRDVAERRFRVLRSFSERILVRYCSAN